MDTDGISFHVGAMYSNQEISLRLNVGNAGGIRISVGAEGRTRRLVLLTSVPQARQARENPYHDRVEGNVLTYTGTGRQGDQELSGTNQRICEQKDNPFPIYGFLLTGSRRDAKLGPKRWKFLGLLEYLRYYQEIQVDTGMVQRATWMFEMRIHEEPTQVVVESDATLALGLAANRQAYGLEEADREIAVSVQGGIHSPGIADALQVELVRKRLLAYSPEQFEHLIRDVLINTGFRDVAVTRYSQDGGIDVNGLLSSEIWPVADLLVQVQAKRWLHTVGRRDVAELRGSLSPFARGCLVTTSQFSKAALLEASEPGKNPITLVSGSNLASIILRANFQIQ